MLAIDGDRSSSGERRDRVPKKPFRLTYPDPTEDQFQQSVVQLLDAILDPTLAVYTHIPVGGYQLSAAAKARLYRLGLKRGWSDIVIAYGLRRTLWLELKTHKGSLSIDQKVWHATMKTLGHKVVVCRTVDQVLLALVEHGVPFRRSRLAEGYLGTMETVPSAASGAATESAQSNSNVGSAQAQEVAGSVVGT